jgi:phosphoglucosamine mutase
LKIVVDAANGAAFRTAPKLIWELGAEVVEIGTKPDGININDGCGSTAPKACQDAVVAHGADLGIALDGDADRVHLIDEGGRLVDGDQLMAVIAEEMMARQQLARSTLVATVLSNLGLERHLNAQRIKMVRTQVGDRHVVERMRALGCNVGGEQSGHIILSDFTTTGDGLIAALQVLSVIAAKGRQASEVLARFEPLPQITRNVRIPSGARPLEQETVQQAVADARAALGADGRLIVRPSGTEPVVRIMAEGEDRSLLERIAEALGGVIAEASAPGEAAVERALAPASTPIAAFRSHPSGQASGTESHVRAV